MKILRTALALTAACLATALTALEPPQPPQPAILRSLKDRTARGTLSDQRELVRGDTGKWSDTATLQHVPPLERKPQSLSLDNWAEQLAEKDTANTAGKKFAVTSSGEPGDDHWLVFRSRQLDDNDRIWVEKIERRSSEFTVTMSEAVWKGRYFKSFTGYEVHAINLGKLPPGYYTAKWIVNPLTCKQLEKPAQPFRDTKDNWPLDEQPAERKPTELTATFSVQGKSK